MKIKINILLALRLGGIGLAMVASMVASGEESKLKSGGSRTKTNLQSARTDTVNTNEYNPSSDKDEAAACKRNLEKISAAIQAYRLENHDEPNWLSGLVPKFLADTNVLVCPVTRRTGQQSAFGVLDPSIYSSYLYEFSPTAIPEIVRGAWPGPAMTMRQWKRQQMKLAGSDVPLVRCLLPEPALNLSVGGKVYESPVFWELNFTNAAIRLEHFKPH